MLDSGSWPPTTATVLARIVASKQAAGREKDRLFLATHRDALETLMRQDED